MARIEILEGGKVVRTIVATPEFMQTQNVLWRLAAKQDIEQVVPTPTEVKHLSKVAYRMRFTTAERVAIEWASVDRPELSIEQRMLSAALRSNMKDQEQASYIDLDDPAIAEGHANLVSAGLLTTYRDAEIRHSAVLEKEKP